MAVVIAVVGLLEPLGDGHHVPSGAATVVNLIHDRPDEMDAEASDVTLLERGLHVGPDFFRILPTHFQAGNEATAMDAPNAMVVTESMARKYFPEYYADLVSIEEAGARVVGEFITLNNDIDLVITGVVDDTRPNTSYKYEYVINQDEFVRRSSWVKEWGNNGLTMLARLTPGADYRAVSGKIEQLINDAVEFLLAEVAENFVMATVGSATTAALSPALPAIVALKALVSAIKAALELLRAFGL